MDDTDLAARRITAIVEQEAPGLLAYFARRIYDVQDAPDLLAETLLIIWRRAGDVPSDPEAARMWLYGVARRVLGTARRSNARRHALADRVRQEMETVSFHANSRGEQRTETSLEELRVRELVGDLAPLDREIIRLSHWEGFSLEEIAQILSKKPATVRSRYARAKTRLRAELDIV